MVFFAPLIKNIYSVTTFRGNLAFAKWCMGPFLPVNLCKLCTEYHHSVFHLSILIANKHKDKTLERLPIWFPCFLSSSWGGHVSRQYLLLGLSISATGTQNYIQCKKLHKGSPFLGTDYSFVLTKDIAFLTRRLGECMSIARNWLQTTQLKK